MLQVIEIMDAWVIPLGSAAIGAFLGGVCTYFLITKFNRDRRDSLYAGLQTEVELVKDHFEDWLPDLIDEFRKPVRERYTGWATTDCDSSCIEALVVELIGAGKVLSKEERKLIRNLHKTLAGVDKEDKQRDEAAENPGEDVFNVPQPSTSRLIAYSVDIIFYLNRYLLEKSNFEFGSGEAPSHQDKKAEEAFELAGLDFNLGEWRRIKQHLLHIESHY